MYTHSAMTSRLSEKKANSLSTTSACSVFLLFFYSFILSVLLASCSMTKNIPEDDQLYVGLKAIDYQPYTESDSTLSPLVVRDNLTATQEEVEAALAAAPNGAIFGSSYYRMPFSVGVSIWNKYAHSTGGFARWMTKTFGKQPVLMSWVNPELRAQVAQNVLHNHGYLNGRVGYEHITGKNPRTAKIAYTVSPGHLHTLDSIAYVGFPAEVDSMLADSRAESYLHRGDAFDVSNLDAERSRISTLLRNNGYYFYQPGYASYLADTFVVEGKAQLQLKLVDGIPAAATHKWYIGRIAIDMKKTAREAATDTLKGRFFSISYAGKKPPIRPRVLMADMKLRPRQAYSYDNYLETTSKINAMGLFSSTTFAFTPRDTTSRCDTLDLKLTCTFDKPWDFYIETNFNSRTIGRMGPELRMGITRRNAFRGGEKIDLNFHGSYEWASGGGSSMNNYEYGADASVQFPRIIAPFVSNRLFRRDKQGKIVRRRRFYSTPTTLAKLSTNIIYRPGYYKMHVVSGEWSYRWQTSENSRHELSTPVVKYQFMNSHTSDFDSVMTENPYLKASMQDHFIPEIRYTYTYTSSAKKLHPVRWETTLAESGNGVAVYDMVMGRSWNEKGKQMFKNPYSQFVKLETDFTKTWTFDSRSKLVAHVNGGIAYAFGNSNLIPSSEKFYVGGANSIRAFSIRGIGPGRFAGTGSKAYSYMVQNGDIKLVGNLEYRHQLFGGLHGAVFIDVGNVWNVEDKYSSESTGFPMDGTTFKLKNIFKDMAVGTGIGMRYDMDFLIIRLDWGVALHLPYDTSRSGFYNVERFKDSHTLHFAIGYPF